MDSPRKTEENAVKSQRIRNKSEFKYKKFYILYTINPDYENVQRNGQIC